jgi:hypothetical protein
MTAVNARICALSLAVFAAGCTTDEPLRYEGVTGGAGDAIAANTVMQMVDPWPAGVEETDLDIPADHDQWRKPAPEDDAEADADASKIGERI